MERGRKGRREGGRERRGGGWDSLEISGLFWRSKETGLEFFDESRANFGMFQLFESTEMEFSGWFQDSLTPPSWKSWWQDSLLMLPRRIPRRSLRFQMKSRRILEDSGRFLKIPKDSGRFSKGILMRFFAGFLKIREDSWESLRILEDSWRFWKISENYWGFLKFPRDHGRFWRILEDSPREF